MCVCLFLLSLKRNIIAPVAQWWWFYQTFKAWVIAKSPLSYRMTSLAYECAENKQPYCALIYIVAYATRHIINIISIQIWWLRLKALYQCFELVVRNYIFGFFSFSCDTKLQSQIISMTNIICWYTHRNMLVYSPIIDS